MIKKYGFSALIILLVVFLSLLIIVIGQPPINKYQEAYSAACQIKDIDNNTIGSGILLTNGNILTSLHVIDTDYNNHISNDEKIVRCQFGNGQITSAIYISGGSGRYSINTDFAFLSPQDKIKLNGFELSKTRAQIGDRLFTIGCPDGLPLHISDGLSTSETDLEGVCSIPIFPGNSGGAIFNSRLEIQGIVSRIAKNREQNIIFTDDGSVMSFETNYITHICYYTPAPGIKDRNEYNVPTNFYGGSLIISLLVVIAYFYVERKTLLV